MTNQEITTQTLIYYIEGLLPEPRVKFIQSKLKEDEFLLAQLNGLVALKEEHPDRELQDLVEELDQIQIDTSAIPGAQQTTQSTKVVSFFPKKYMAMAIAASVALLIAITTILYLQNGDQRQLSQLKTDYIQNIEFVRGANAGLSKSFGNKNYEDVIAKVSTIETLNSDDHLLVGIAYIETNQPQKALEHLELLTNNVMYSEDAWFAISVCYYEMENYNEALNAVKNCKEPLAKKLEELIKNKMTE